MPLDESRYNQAWRDSFHFVRHAAQPDWLAFIHKSASVEGQVALGNQTVVGMHSEIRAPHKLVVGGFTNLAGHFTLVQDGAHNTAYASSYGFNAGLGMDLDRPDVLGPDPDKPYQCIGSDVWVAARVILLPGVDLADGCVVGAGSVVTKDTEAFCVYAGNPARLIRRRFAEVHAEALVELAWWDWPIERIERNRALFDTDLTVFDGDARALAVD